MSPLRLPTNTREWCVAAAGIALVVTGAAATQPWLDRHFLPSFLISRQAYVRIETSVRLFLVLSGISLTAGARRVASMLTARSFAVAGAALLALAASELFLRT